MRSFFILLIVFLISIAFAGELFVGIESAGVATYSSNMEGFPAIDWDTLYNFEVSGAAASPEGTLYIIEGAFTTHLYSATLSSSPQQLCTIDEDMSALAYGRGTLYGYSNYADPKGIYSIDPETGETNLVLDVYTGTGYRFFGLDYNPEDDLFYGYTEYGASGLYSINIDSGEMIQLVGTIPATNGQGRGLAVGNNTVYLTATRGDDGIPYFAYDISQGIGGNWLEFPNPYPNHHSTGGAAFIPDQIPAIQISGLVVGSDDLQTGISGCEVNLIGEENYQTTTDMFGNFVIEEVIGETNYEIEIIVEGFENYNENIQAGSVDIDLGTITLQEIAFPVTNVTASLNDEETEAIISWFAPAISRDLESYQIYRFLEIYSGNPANWEIIGQDFTDTLFIDYQWEELPPDIYQFAVVAIYTNENVSSPAFSNILEKLEVSANDCIIKNSDFITNYPNPFNPNTNIRFAIDYNSHIKLVIYNTKGQIVRTLADENVLGEIFYEYNWNGMDDNGNKVSSGIYMYKLITDQEIFSRKMILLK